MISSGGGSYILTLKKMKTPKQNSQKVTYKNRIAEFTDIIPIISITYVNETLTKIEIT
jgi:hypothetical protein